MRDDATVSNARSHTHAHAHTRRAARSHALTFGAHTFARPVFLGQTPVMGFCKLEQVIPLADGRSGCVAALPSSVWCGAPPPPPLSRSGSCVRLPTHRCTVNRRFLWEECDARVILGSRRGRAVPRRWPRVRLCHTGLSLA